MNPDQEAVIENSKWIDSLLLTGVSVAGGCVLARLVGVREIEILQAKISVTAVWIVLAALTVAHFYVSWLLNRSIFNLWLIGSEERSREVFQEITAKGGLLVRGLSPRTDGKTWLGLKVYEMRPDDPSSWAAHAISILLVAAIVPFELSHLGLFCKMLGIAIGVVLVNWLIGSSWVARLSELDLPREESRLLEAQQERSLMVVSTGAVLLAMLVAAIPFWVLILLTVTGIVGRRHLSIGLTLGLLLLVPLVARRALAVRRFSRALFAILFFALSIAIVIIASWLGVV